MNFAENVRNALIALGTKISPLVFLAEHAGRILKVDQGSGRVDIVADDEDVGGQSGLSRREVLVGLPGVKLAMAAGDRIRFGAAGGSATGTEVRMFEQDRNADRPAARKGDTIKVGTLTIAKNKSPQPPGLTLTYLAAPSPYSPIPTIPKVLLIGGSLTIAPDPFTIELEGWVDSGSAEILMRHLSTETIP
jgi:hypothetical protein